MMTLVPVESSSRLIALITNNLATEGKTHNHNRQTMDRRQEHSPVVDSLNSSSMSICSSVSTMTCSVASSSRSISTCCDVATVIKPVSSLSCSGMSCDEEQEELNSARWLGSYQDGDGGHDPWFVNERPLLNEEGGSSPTNQSPKVPTRPPESPTKVLEPPTRKPAWQLREELKKQRPKEVGEDHEVRDFIPKMPKRSTRVEKSDKDDLGVGDAQEIEGFNSRQQKLMKRINKIQQMLASDPQHYVPSLFEDACRKSISRSDSSKKTTKAGALQESACSDPPRMPVRVVSKILHLDLTIVSNDSSHSKKSKTNKKSKTSSSSSASTKKARRKKKTKTGCDENSVSETQDKKASKQNHGKSTKEQVERKEASSSRSRSRSRSPKQSTPIFKLTAGATTTSKAPKRYIRRGGLRRHKSERRVRRDYIRNSLSSILEDDDECRSPMVDVNTRRKLFLMSRSCPSLSSTPDDNNAEYSPRRRDNMRDPDRSFQNPRCWQGVGGSRTLTVN
jgi:hypothetical protein